MHSLKPLSLVALACAAALASTASHAVPAVMAAGLKQLVAESDAADPRLAKHMRLHVANAAGEPMVHVHLAADADPQAALAKLKASGFKVTAVSTLDPRHVEGYLPLRNARAAAAVAGVKSVYAVQRPIRYAGSVQSQAVALQKADIAQSLGFDGTGIKIAALSDSYDECATCSIHAADDIATGDLPAGGVTVLADIGPSDGGEDEGRAMLQLIHDIAPGAKLGFATAFIGEVDFANRILQLRSQFGADVIVDDVGYFDEPMYSDGVIAQAVDQVVANGAAYYSSAGNNGLEAYEATYRPAPWALAKQMIAQGAGNLKLDQIPAALRPQSIHVFSGDTATGSTISLSQKFTTAADNRISFQWDEPFFQGKVKTDFNIYVFDADGNWMDPSSADFPGFYSLDDNTVTDEAFEFVELPPFAGEIHGGANVSTYQIVIGNLNGGPARHIKYINDNGLGVSQFQGAPAIFGHAAASKGQAVAATYYAIPSFPEDFSAPGPVTIYFDNNGNTLAQPVVRAVPQITAADGVDTTFFGFDSDGNGLPNFFGTSAAAPDAAATAALVLQAAGGPGSLTPAALYKVLQNTATPIPVPNSRTSASAVAGPVVFNIKGDWVRWANDFGIILEPQAQAAISTVVLDTASTGLTFSLNLARFHVGDSKGVTLADVTPAVSSDAKKYTLTFKPGAFVPGESLRFGTSIFNPLQGSTQLDPDRFRGMNVTITLANGQVFTAPVQADPKVAVNRFTGVGLVNAAAAVQAVQAVPSARKN